MPKEAGTAWIFRTKKAEAEESARGKDRETGAWPVGAKRPAHAPDGLGHDRDGKQFQSMASA
jgi:hypothetical protein